MSRVYVGTYRKYNEGSIAGEWLELEDYDSRADFYEACRELHSDETDPELMFQDWEEIPGKYITESSIDEALWDWLELTEYEREIASIYIDDVDQSADPKQAIEAYDGEYESNEDWARELWESTGMADEIPKFAQNYIDYKSFAHDAHIGGDMTFVNKGMRVIAFRRL
jgi:antirestriction protein